MQITKLTHKFIILLGVIILSYLCGIFPLQTLSNEMLEFRESCLNSSATELLRLGVDLQKDKNPEAASRSFLDCIKLDPRCIACQYELGWAHWNLGEWDKVVEDWEKVLELNPQHSGAKLHLPNARKSLELLEKKSFNITLRTSTELLTKSTPTHSPVALTLIARWQSYNQNTSSPLDHYDPDIYSPKSIIFNKNGNLVFLNSLEGGKTIVYDASGLEKKTVIYHHFDKKNAQLLGKKAPFHYHFPKHIKNPNIFDGKPVESTLSHDGKYLWVTYYRRNFDKFGNYPSGVALIDASTFEIIKVFGTGPIAKYVKVSPSGKWLAISHWGDNTVGLFDISSNTPSEFKESALLIVEKKLKLGKLIGDRDRNCGFCVRGLAFTKDSRYLFVSRMRKGGIAVFNLKNSKTPYMGTLFGINLGPRDLHIDQTGEWLYSSCNASGLISKIPTQMIINKLSSSDAQVKKGKITINPSKEGVVSVYAGLGIRSFKLSPDNRYLFAASNQTSEVLAIRTQDMKIISRISIDSYPVGLDISPDGSKIWVTSQGRNGHGGNSVSVLQVRYKLEETIQNSSDPKHVFEHYPGATHKTMKGGRGGQLLRITN